MDDLTFRVQFGGDGAAKLRDRVMEKLKEFMGDYTDDNLVEYVIVLLKNGRHKEEAKSELNVFLGDDSDSFVSWLWDHLQSNLYVQPGKSCPNEVAKPKSISGEQGEKTDPHRMDSEPVKENIIKLSKRRHIKEWKGLVRDAHEPPPLRSAMIANIHSGEEGNNQRIDQAKRSPSPRVTHMKRSRHGERPQRGEIVSKSGAPRKLLQFAVRDAVSTPGSSTLTPEPSLKRLRSVVSASTDDFSPQNRPRSFSRMPNVMAVAIKAVAEAAKDVVKVKHSGSVFDRLGHGIEIYDSTDHLTDYREPSTKYDRKYRGFSLVQDKTHSTYHQSPDKNVQFVRNMSMLESDAGVVSDFVSDNNDYGNGIGQDYRAMDDNSLLVANRLDETARNLPNVQDQPAAIATATSNTFSKIVNVSSNINTRKPSHYQEPRSDDVENQKFVQEGIHAAGLPTEDADSRTIFISNVHFAATKDSLSLHLNKFVEVLKVAIITDAATGQPKGSAYVEFMRKEAAERALSLDGASFMSRILKVVRKSSGQQEAAAPAVTWPHGARGSPFGASSRFIRGVPPYPRSMSSMYRSRLPIKPGARSLQWKRGDAQSTTLFDNFIPSPTSRSLTYVRPELKIIGDSSGPA